MPPKSEAGRDVKTLPRACDWASESLMCFHQRAGTNESCCHERESVKSMRRRKRARTRARSGQKRVQISIFGGVDFFHTAVEGRTNYLPPYPGSTVRYPLGGWYVGVASIAAITAAISPTWLDWASPGILIARFLRLFWSNHIPLPHLASCFPLFIQAPSVYMVISLHLGMGPCGRCRLVIWWVILLGSVNILKHSARLSLQVIVGSKVIVPSRCLAIWFLSFPDFVRDSPSGGSCFVGLCLGGIRFSLVSASSAHSWGFRHPCSLSRVHSGHSHSGFLWCVGCCRGCLRRADVFTRSATFVMLCFFIKHFARLLFSERGSAVRWYHAGSWARICGVILIAARFVLYFLAVSSIRLMSSFRFCALGPLRGTFHDCRKGLSLAGLIEWAGAVASTIWSVIVTHCWREGVKLR